jgi:Cdc6-like AAA superfamily ATPase
MRQRSPKNGLTYDTSFARFLSPTLATAPVLDQDLVDNFVRQFQATSWNAAASTSAPSKRSLIVIAGPCGAGKSTIAKAVSKEYAIP